MEQKVIVEHTKIVVNGEVTREYIEVDRGPGTLHLIDRIDLETAKDIYIALGEKLKSLNLI